MGSPVLNQPIDERDPNAIPPLPPAGEVLTEQALYLTQIANYRNTLAFSGQKNPSNIWTSMVRDDSVSMIYYRELEEKDDDVSNALDTLKLSVLERDRTLEPADDSGEAETVREFVQEQLDNIPNFHQVLDCMLDAAGYGFSVAEMIFDVSEKQVGLIDINDCPQELFLFGPRYHPQVGQLQLLDTPYGMSGQPMPEQKFMIFSYRSRARNRMGRPLLRSVFWPSWFKRNILSMWLRYCEKGPGTAVVRYPDGDNDSEKRRAAAMAQAIIEAAAVAVPQNFNIELELLKSARTLDPAVYEHLYQSMQYSIVRRILGETLTSFGGEQGKGTQALGNVHADTKEQRSVELCKALAGVINRQLIRPLVLWNFGPNAPIPVWGFDVSQEEDLTKRAAIDSTLQKMGAKIGAKYVQDRYDLPPVEDGDEVLTPNASAPQIPAGDPSDPNKPQFSEHQFEHDVAEFDKLIGEMKKEAMQLCAERTREIAQAVRK